MPKVFVYGTLMSHNSSIMRDLGCRDPVPARLEGYALYQVAPHFPGAVPEPGGVILGEIWEAPEEAFDELDWYEDVDSGLYRREQVEVAAADGRRVKAVCYIWNRPPVGRKVPPEEQPWRKGKTVDPLRGQT